VFSNQ